MYFYFHRMYIISSCGTDRVYYGIIQNFDQEYNPFWKRCLNYLNFTSAHSVYGCMLTQLHDSWIPKANCFPIAFYQGTNASTQAQRRQISSRWIFTIAISSFFFISEKHRFLEYCRIQATSRKSHFSLYYFRSFSAYFRPHWWNYVPFGRFIGEKPPKVLWNWCGVLRLFYFSFIFHVFSS